jgi:hypothetical protein
MFNLFQQQTTVSKHIVQSAEKKSFILGNQSSSIMEKLVPVSGAKRSSSACSKTDQESIKQSGKKMKQEKSGTLIYST